MTQPKLGPDDALVTIVEWCDLRAKECRDVDAPMNKLLQRYAGRLRWVLRQLPDPKRSDSALVHNFARGMFQQGGKFWEARERLMKRPDDTTLTKDDLREIAGELGADWAALEKGIEERIFARYVGVDILFAGKFGVDAGPAFFVNGRRLPSVPAGALEQALSTLIEEELAEADRHIRRGVAKTDVYREITEDGLWAVDDDPGARRAANAQSTAGAGKGP
jgi:protein-disulfide isomerase